MPDLKTLIREVPDFPKPGILFYDITTLIKDKAGFRGIIDGLKDHYRDTQVDVVLGIEARGFIFAPALAYALNAGFVPVRKPKKLPSACVTVTYDLEYGTDTLEMHSDAVGKGDRVLIVDDLLATGGTAATNINYTRQPKRPAMTAPLPLRDPGGAPSTGLLSAAWARPRPAPVRSAWAVRPACPTWR